ncbi:MAG: tetratricopeptide repeat protein [Bacteroidetes bacterium]|nr:tetratricopeptide repeat protein [Bacteroidota bacterium]
MINLRSLLFLIFCIPSAALQAGKYFDFSASAQSVYQQALNLRLTEARNTLEQVKRNEPDNLIAVYLENYIDFFTIFANDVESEYRNLSKNMDKRLEKLARGDRRSPYYLYTQAEVRLQWAILRIRFGDYLTGASDVKLAYALLEQNQKKFPDFIANKKSLGLLHAMVGNLPDDYKWVVRSFGGMSGTTDQGLKELEEVMAYAKQHDFIFEEEAVVTYAFLQLYLNNKPGVAWEIIKNSPLNPKNSPLANYALATVAMRAEHNDDAIKMLQNFPTGGSYSNLHQRYYMLGLAKLRRLDQDANKSFELFLQQYKGTNGIKECYQKLAWYSLVQGNPGGYRQYIEQVKQHGADNSEPDKAALAEAKSNEMPDVRLIKARLLFDAGYYQRAYDLLKSAEADYKSNRKLYLEYTYRLGRITHKMGKSPEALRYYQQTLDQGANEPWYFACNAALQMGLVYEEKRDYSSARNAFQRCLSLKPSDYSNSLHAQAKAGMSRCKNK